MSSFANKALITGIAGQDGSYLAELLLSKGYEVHGVVRRVSIEDSAHKLKNISHIVKELQLHVASLDNVLSLIKIIKDVKPQECYHLAASSFVSYSFEDELSILNNNLNATHYLLAAIKEFAPQCRVYFAGSSEMFGNASQSPQDESTPFNPRSIYGISKVAGYHLVKNYRNLYDIFACSGILYNHESPRRGYEYVTQKIVSSAVRIKLGLQKTLELGNLDAHRDWGYAPDYVNAMWLMLQYDKPSDYVIASGKTRSVRSFAETVFNYLDLNIDEHIEINSKFYRPSEKVRLCGNSGKAIRALKWCRTKTFEAVIHEMIDYEMSRIQGVGATRLQV
jgi:GDPmannose 4,6-dehydratase